MQQKTNKHKTLCAHARVCVCGCLLGVKTIINPVSLTGPPTCTCVFPTDRLVLCCLVFIHASLSIYTVKIMLSWHHNIEKLRKRATEKSRY